ncbi:MAG: hypothetical protein ACK5KQ_02790 [Anaerorhabdus sp.]
MKKCYVVGMHKKIYQEFFEIAQRYDIKVFGVKQKDIKKDLSTIEVFENEWFKNSVALPLFIVDGFDDLKVLALNFSFKKPFEQLVIAINENNKNWSALQMYDSAFDEHTMMKDMLIIQNRLQYINSLPKKRLEILDDDQKMIIVKSYMFLSMDNIEKNGTISKRHVNDLNKLVNFIRIFK